MVCHLLFYLESWHHPLSVLQSVDTRISFECTTPLCSFPTLPGSDGYKSSLLALFPPLPSATIPNSKPGSNITIYVFDLPNQRKSCKPGRLASLKFMISHLCWSLSTISLYFSSVHTLVSLSDLVKPSLSHSWAPYSTLLLPISVFGSPPCFINTVGTFDYNFLNFHIPNINIHKSHISSFSSLKNEVWEFPHPVQKQSFPCVPWPTPTPITSWTLALKFPPISQTILSIQALSFATTVMLESLHCFKVLQKTPPLRTRPLETTFFSYPCRSKTAGSTKLFTNSLLFRHFLLTLQSTISDFTLFISQIELLVRSALVPQMQKAVALLRLCHSGPLF